MNVYVYIYIQNVYNGSCEYLALVACRKDNAFRMHGKSRTYINAIWALNYIHLAFCLKSKVTGLDFQTHISGWWF